MSLSTCNLLLYDEVQDMRKLLPQHLFAPNALVAESFCHNTFLIQMHLYCSRKLPLQHLFAPNALVAESFRYKQTRVVSRRRPELGLRRITAKDCNLQPPCLAGSRPKVLRATYYALETKHYVLPLSSFCTTCAHGWFCTACAYCLVAWYVLAAI
jgi:hypothetical protein